MNHQIASFQRQRVDLMTALGGTSFSARDVADTVAREVCFGDNDKLTVATVKHQTGVR